MPAQIFFWTTTNVTRVPNRLQVINPTRHAGGAEAVVDVHDCHAARAAIQHPEKRGDSRKARTVSHTGGHGDHGHANEATDDTGQRSFHASHDDHDTCTS